LRGSSIIARDISDRRKAERLKDGFLSLVSHELRTPLSAIVAHVELLLDDDLLSEQRQRFVEVVHRNSLRLERLVGDLLFVAQLESADLTVTMTDVDIVTIAKDAVEAAAPRAGGSGVDLRFEPGGNPVRMVGDAGRLGQAVDNLISNAIKYSPDGGAVCVRVLPDASECIIEVQDEGVGIAFDEQEHLFERFYRAPTAASLHVQGIGLGLLIVKKIVDAHGGHVSVRSEPGSGATFRMMLPLDPTVRRSTPSAVPALARSSAR
jgi:signal transduction histidine kinase